MKRCRKKLVVIEAVQWTGDNLAEVVNFMEGSARELSGWGKTIHIHTLEGIHLATIGDFIIKGVHGEFYPCKPDIFAETYEEVSDKNAED